MKTIVVTFIISIISITAYGLEDEFYCSSGAEHIVIGNYRYEPQINIYTFFSSQDGLGFASEVLDKNTAEQLQLNGSEKLTQIKVKHSLYIGKPGADYSFNRSPFLRPPVHGKSPALHGVFSYFGKPSVDQRKIQIRMKFVNKDDVEIDISHDSKFVDVKNSLLVLPAKNKKDSLLYKAEMKFDGGKVELKLNPLKDHPNCYSYSGGGIDDGLAL